MRLSSVATARLLVAASVPRSLPPRLGLFDGLKSAAESVTSAAEGVKSAYEDDSFVPPGFARASHILFLADDDAEKKAAAVKRRIESGEFSFGSAALSFSCCPTRDLNGALGTFQSLSRLREGTLQGTDSMPYDGQDTSPFDELVFSSNTALNVVHTVNTQWGTHLVLVEERGEPALPSTEELARAGADRAVAEAADLIRPILGSSKATTGEGATNGFGGNSVRGGSGKKRKKKR